MSNVPATQQSNLPATQQQNSGQEQILKSDIVLPKVLLMQALSKLLKGNKSIRAGDLVRSTTSEKLGDGETALEFIPLTFTNLWMLTEDEKGKGIKDDYKFRGYEPRTASNESMEWDYLGEGGTKWRRTKVMQVYALLVRDLEKIDAAMDKFEKDGVMPDLDSALLPVVIPFRSSSFKAAKDVATLFVKAADIAAQLQKRNPEKKIDVPVYGRTMKLMVLPESKDDHDYFVLRAVESGPTKQSYLSECNRWRTTLIQMGNNVKVDESDVDNEPAAGEEPFNNQF